MAAAAVVQPQTVLTIDPKHRLVEGVASDGVTIWISSVLDAQILACRNTCRTLAKLPAGLHPFAIAWDADRRRLWVAADCPPGVIGIKPCERGALVGLNSAGRVIARIAPPSGSFHPGDVSAARAGVFVSDSQNGAVYALAKSGYNLTALVKPGVGKSGQGSALDPSGERLIVADYEQGVTAVNLASGDRTILKRDDGRPVHGIDGLLRCGTDYYAIYNGAPPGRLFRLTINGEKIAIETLIEGGVLADPTQLAFDGKRLLIVADSGWATLDKPGFARTAGAPVVAIPLGPDCKPQ